MVVWRKDQTWAEVKVHMGSNQEAYDTECAVLDCALEQTLERIEILE